MKEQVYKVEVLGIAFSTKNTFKEKLQELLDDYSSKGWKLYTMQVTQDICTCVFERE